ncbi:hypothetical protein XAP412_800005 [Xanthomonas phaseoli pv. phaseoli]|uniref:Uncharacterized protein n=1 Tax=Xanthomonas campestris pv. phaseoli TaxID=317013 RepID=A0AB38E544_XANCH|nr:hypothetical protein XAP6984_840005 [Xanthomonas phaseoli pv. phaseoli]SON90808.1 hypothetical protein XAP412_800005 [Xanthomonas phaseoli pv. phaseoli]SON92667.1 hypothetical protein XAP7430_800005 [Xanthomonas phaseoli pv. phaseoli]
MELVPGTDRADVRRTDADPWQRRRTALKDNIACASDAAGTYAAGRCVCGCAPFSAPALGCLRTKPAAARSSCGLSASQRTLQVQGGARYRTWPGGNPPTFSGRQKWS